MVENDDFTMAPVAICSETLGIEPQLSYKFTPDILSMYSSLRRCTVYADITAGFIRKDTTC